jgi:hypothetical protein
MKTLAASLIAVTALLTFTSCTTVVEAPAAPVTRTTTTEETTTVQRPQGTTTETHVRSY